MPPRTVFVLFFLTTTFVAGVLTGLGRDTNRPAQAPQDAPVFSHGYQPQSFFDKAYAKVSQTPRANAFAILSAHHLLIPDKIADVFSVIATDKPVTVVVVSPNHFHVGHSPAQTVIGSWTTPYGYVETDDGAIASLTSTLPFLKPESETFKHEHGIAALTPFLARSLPNAQIVPIALDDSLAPEDAWLLGETIARELPDAKLVASVDMTHYQDAAYTSENDARVLDLLANAADCAATRCAFDLDIDSNPSLRVLLGFVGTHQGAVWNLTHHGSSLEMGATDDPAENTSHILGYFSLK